MFVGECGVVSDCEELSGGGQSHNRVCD